MSTGLTFGTISSLYGLNAGIIDRTQFSLLLTVVVGSAVIPTLIAQRWFAPRHALRVPERPPEGVPEPAEASAEPASGILVAVDGSDPARNALEAALDLALELEASVEVLAVEGALPRYAATIGEVDDAVRERERFFARVLGEARAIARERGLEVTSTLRPGHPAEEIVRHAEATGANLIVRATAGTSSTGFPSARRRPG